MTFLNLAIVSWLKYTMTPQDKHIAAITQKIMNEHGCSPPDVKSFSRLPCYRLHVVKLSSIESITERKSKNAVVTRRNERNAHDCK